MYTGVEENVKKNWFKNVKNVMSRVETFDVTRLFVRGTVCVGKTIPRQKNKTCLVARDAS